MTDVLFKCPECSKHLAVDEAAKGRSMRCVDCGRPVEVPQETVPIVCPACGWDLSAPGVLAGDEFNCPNCTETFVVPKPSMVASRKPSLTCGTEQEPVKPPLSFKRSLSTPSGSGQDRSNTGRRCPGCGKSIAPTAVICLICGFNLRTVKPVLASGTTTPSSIMTPYWSLAPTADGLREAEEALARVRGSTAKESKSSPSGSGINWEALENEQSQKSRAGQSEPSASESGDYVGWFMGVVIGAFLIGAICWYNIVDGKAKAAAAKEEAENAEAHRVEQQRWESLSEEQKHEESERAQINMGYKVLGDGDATRGRAVADKIIEDENDRRMRQSRGILDVHIVP